MKIAAIVLAAGAGRRFLGETPKLLMEIDGKPIIRLTVEQVAAAGFKQIIVVTGAYADQVSEALKGLPVTIVLNEGWKDGQSSSLLRGMIEVKTGMNGVCIALGDQPRVRIDTYKKLMTELRRHPQQNIAPSCGGRRGNPVIIPSCYFVDLLNSLSGDKGGRKMLDQKGVYLVKVTDTGVVQDIDTLEDYNRNR